MAMFPFVGSSYNGRSASFDAQRTLNMYLEGSESKTSRTPAMLIGTPGLLLWATTVVVPPPPPFSAYPVLAAAYAAGRGVVAIVGDSITAGVGSAASGQYQLSSSIRLIADLNTAGITAIDGFLWGDHGSGNLFTYDTRVTSPIPGRWSGGNGSLYTSTTVGAQFTLAQGNTYDRVRKGYITSPGNGTYTLTKNGAVFATIVEGATLGLTVATYSPASGTQSVVVDHTVAGTGVNPLPFIQTYPSATQHIQVCQIGNSGWTTALWSANSGVPFDPLDNIVALDADLYIIWLGANDASSGVATATFKANLQTIITALLAMGNVVLAVTPPAGGTGIGFNISAAYKTALAELTATNSLAALIDFNTALSPFDFHDFDTDGVHPKAATHVFLGQYLAATLRGTTLPTRPARPVSGSGWGSTGTNVTLSGTNSVTATNDAAEWNLARSSTSKTDRRFFEVNNVSLTNQGSIGVCNATQALDGFWGGSPNACVLNNDGNIYYNGGSVSSGLGTFTTGDTIGVDVDPVGTQVRFQKNGGVFTSWQSIPLVGATVYGAAWFNGNASQVTGNFSEDPPSGSAKWTP